MMKHTKKELLKMPHRKWDDTSRKYDWVLLVPSGHKHDSGYMHVAIIGVWVEEKKEKYEICCMPDDITCYFPMLKLADRDYPLVRMDCYYPSGIFRYHGDGKFTVNVALSSMDFFITFTQNKK